MKKIICLLIVFNTIFFNTCFFASAEAEDRSADKNCAEFLVALNLIDSEDENPDVAITRAEFVSNALKMIQAPVLPSAGGPVYSDVTETYWARDEIAAATEMGIVHGAGNGMFYPDNPIFLHEASKIMLCLLGYDKMMKNLDEASVIQKAYEAGLLDGITVSGNMPITRASLYRIMYNALDVDMVTADFSGESLAFSVEEGTTILSEYYDIDDIKGIVEATEYMAIDSGGAAAKGYIRVSGELYEISYDTYDLSGKYVKLYFKEDTGGSKKVVYIDDTKNIITEIDAEDYEGFDGNRIQFYAGNRVKYCNISSNASFIYNNRLLYGEEIKTVMGNIPNGKIRLIDNNSGSYEIVIITGYTNYKAESVVIEDEIIKFDSGKSYPLSKYSGYTIFNSDGEEKRLGDIMTGAVVSVFDPGNTSLHIILYYSDEVIPAKITALDSESEKVTLDTGETVSAYKGINLFNSISMGTEYNISLDAFGKAYKLEAKADKSGVVYLMAAGIEENAEQELKLRVLDYSGNKKILTCSENVVVRKADGETKKMSVEDAYAELSENAVTKRQVLRVFSDAENNVSKIEFPADSNNEAATFRKVYVPSVAESDAKYKFRWTLSSRSFMNKIVMNEDAVVFCVPADTDTSPSETLFRAEKLNYLRNNTFYNYLTDSNASGLYKMTPISMNAYSYTADVLVLEYSEAADHIFNSSTYGMLVTKIAEKYDEKTGEVKFVISLVKADGTSTEAMYDDNGSGAVKDKNGRTVNPGDIIRFENTTDGQAEAFCVETFYDKENKQVLICHADADYRFSSSYRVAKAKLIKKYGGYMWVEVTHIVSATDGMTVAEELLPLSGVNIMQWISSKKVLENYDGEPMPYDEFVIEYNSGVPKRIIYYN